MALDPARLEKPMHPEPVEAGLLDDGDPNRTFNGRFHPRLQPAKEFDQASPLPAAVENFEIFWVPGESTVSTQVLWLSSKEAQSVLSFRATYAVGWLAAECIEYLLAMLLTTAREYQPPSSLSFRHGIFMLHDRYCRSPPLQPSWSAFRRASAVSR